MNEKWDIRFLKLAKEVSTWSKDSSTQVGCVITTPDRRIISTGYNGLPRQCNDNIKSHPERHIRPTDGGSKYSWYEHGERNAIYNAAYLGVSLKDCIIYVTTSLPCVDCSRAIIQSGIKKVVWEQRPDDPAFISRWAESMEISEVMFNEAKVVTLGLQLHPQVLDL